MFRIPDVQEINRIKQLTDAEIDSITGKSFLYVEKINGEPKLKSEILSDILPNPLIAANIQSNNISNIGAGALILSSTAAAESIQLRGSDATCAITVSTNASPTKQLCLSYNADLDRGQITALHQGTGLKNLQFGTGAGQISMFSGDIHIERGETNYHSIGGIQTTGQRNHTFMDRSGIIAATYQIERAIAPILTSFHGHATYLPIGFYNYRGSSNVKVPVTGNGYLHCVFETDAACTIGIKMEQELTEVFTGTISFPNAGVFPRSVSFLLSEMPASSGLMVVSAFISVGTPGNLLARQLYLTYGTDSA